MAEKKLMIKDIDSEEWEEFKTEESAQKDGYWNLEEYELGKIYTYQYKVVEV